MSQTEAISTTVNAKAAKKVGPATTKPKRSAVARPAYSLEDQVGFLLRQATQRHVVLFAAGIGGDITPTQWAALTKLQGGPVSQNLLGRQTAMDAATVKGVIDRLTRRGLTETKPDPADGRRLLVMLTPRGRTVLVQGIPKALEITDQTLSPLKAKERETFLKLLSKLR